ncbi:LysR substrate-binding domain-containing protein [Serratia proteamaculans]|uniref:LysR substrate-binding domain-containing protein n=1 Tax=Serratia proteamaculans TaxID=28151 RepID=UPI0039BE8158
MKLKLNAQPRLPSLKALHTFEVAARCASFTEAAEELNVTLGAVSRQIRHLENELGVELFHRKGNAVELNDTGKRLAIDVTRALTLLQKASDRARPEQQQTLRLTCTLGIASHWLAARLPALRRADPDVSLVLDANESLRDLANGEADIAIRYSPTATPPPHSRELLADAFAPLASPAFLTAHPELVTPADLALSQLIHSPWKDGQKMGVAGWQDWFAAFGEGVTAPRGILTFNSVGHALQEAIEGHGIVLGSLAVAQDALTSGKLVRLFGESRQLPATHQYRLCWADSAFVSATTRRWVDLLLQAAGKPSAF